MQADQERLARLRIRIYRVDRAGTELVGQIADLMDLDVLVPKIMPLKRVDVRERWWDGKVRRFWRLAISRFRDDPIGATAATTVIR